MTIPPLPTNGKTSSPKVAWLFSPAVDLAAFLGSALLAFALLFLGYLAGWLDQDTPAWIWVPAILLIDVAHVYATGFRVYFLPNERRKHPWLYFLTPILAFFVGVAVYSAGSITFWRILAYLAVFHFVRQQYGWVALYRAKAGENSRLGLWIDRAVIYLATLYPLIYWHAHLPRDFSWFMQGDFTSISPMIEQFTRPLYWISIVLYIGKGVYLGVVRQEFNPGKDLVVITTLLCWYIGIITFNSDYAFTVTNVIIHGIPYMILVYWYRWERNQKSVFSEEPSTSTGARRVYRVVQFLGVIWVLAYMEEMLWDTGVWHERGWLFGSLWNLDVQANWLVPLLAVPQITHYVLDGFIWRRRSSKKLSKHFRPSEFNSAD